MNKVQYSCVLTYPTPSLIACNTTGMMHLKIKSGISHRMLVRHFQDARGPRNLASANRKLLNTRMLFAVSGCGLYRRRCTVRRILYPRLSLKHVRKYLVQLIIWNKLIESSQNYVTLWVNVCMFLCYGYSFQLVTCSGLIME